MANTIKFPIGSLRLKPAPMPTPEVMASAHPAVAQHLKQQSDYCKQVFESAQQLAAAVRELQALQK